MVTEDEAYDMTSIYTHQKKKKKEGVEEISQRKLLKIPQSSYTFEAYTR